MLVPNRLLHQQLVLYRFYLRQQCYWYFSILNLLIQLVILSLGKRCQNKISYRGANKQLCPNSMLVSDMTLHHTSTLHCFACCPHYIQHFIRDPQIGDFPLKRIKKKRGLHTRKLLFKHLLTKIYCQNVSGQHALLQTVA